MAVTRLAPATTSPRPRTIRWSGSGPETGEQPKREIDWLHWGLVPSWAKDPAVGNRMFNARAESVPDKPAFRKALARRRCLVPASGYFEWQKINRPGAGKGGRAGTLKQPFYITPKDGSVLAFAGLWEYWRPAPDADGQQGDAIVSYTILTSEPVGVMRGIHDRMPLILPAADWDAWLDPGLDEDQVRLLLQPPDPNLIDKLELRPVGQRIGSVDNDDPGLLVPVEPMPEPHPGSAAGDGQLALL